MNLTDEQEANARKGVDQAAQIVSIFGWYATGPREQNLNLAREAFDRAGIPLDQVGVAEVEWAKKLVEDMLRKWDLEPRGTEIIRGLEAGVDLSTPPRPTTDASDVTPAENKDAGSPDGA